MGRSVRARAAAIPPPVAGFLLIVLASALFAAMLNTIRFVTVSEGIHPFEAAFFRNLFGIIVFIPWFLKNGFTGLRTKYLGMHLGRAGLNTVSMLSWFTALSLMPVADATALGLMGPVFVAVLAMIFLAERVGPRRWFGIGLAMAGGLIIIRPGFSEVGLGTWLILFAAVIAASSKLMAKVLSGKESAATIVALLTVLMVPITLVPALFVWQTPTLYQLIFLALIGVFGTFGHLLFVQAYKMADISLVEPAIFTRMIWAALIGFVLFAEFPDMWTWIGGGVIVVGTTYIARREAVRGVKKVPVAEAPVGD
ncbi:MAG: drug/metabolite transporter (DMT)-like permease [Alphaproteobacteria bacterium]|jgi:drug/metabolite transporter (DMT)-like permease